MANSYGYGKNNVDVIMGTTSVFGKIAAALLTISLIVPGHSARLSTWTIVGVDLKTGDVGVAGATCLPGQHADAVAVLVPGKGAAAVQAFWDMDNRNKVYELLRAGDTADEIVRRVIDRVYDNDVDDRQYGVVTMKNGVVQIESFTGKGAIPWAGSRQDRATGVTVQGNILASPEVVSAALRAFQEDGSLEDRLIRGLEAGSAAGGDVRCNSGHVRQTAASAFILVAHGGDLPYSAPDLGVTDQDTSRAPWLDISVIEPQFGPNPVQELRKRFDQWRRRLN
jgi:uncharacterized Ntn-hydrolase superfamily protein